MTKFTTIASLAVVAIGLSAISGGAAVAARLAATSNHGSGYDKQTHEAPAAQSNRHKATTDAPYGFGSSHPNQANAPTHRS